MIDGLEIGSVLDGRYRIDSVLGAGGMGRVYRGEHVGIGRAVAIKVLHANMHQNREAAQRFQREALASGRLDHANIVGVSDFGVLDGGAAFLVMEALEGTSLGYRIEDEGRIPWREAIAIMRGILAGLHHAHDRGVVHRDIKPDNVFLALKDGETVVKILDFGIAKLYAGSADDPASTSVGLTVGTPAYLSPEQAVGGEITPRSDLYSASIVLFEMIAGRVPFEAADPLAMLGAHIGQPAPRIGDVAPEVEVPAALEELLQRGLVKLPAQRIDTAAEYLAALEALLASPIGSDAPRRAPSPATFRISSPVQPVQPVQPPAPALSSMTPAALGVMPTAAFEPVAHASTMAQAIGLPPVPAGSLQAIADQRKRRVVAVGMVAVGLVAVLLALAGGSDTPLQAAMQSPAVASAPGALREGSDATAPLLKKPPPEEPPPVVRPAAVVPAPPPAPKPPPTVVPPPPLTTATSAASDRALSAALKTLTNARSCKLRKSAIPKLVALKDPRAIEPLKKARRRMSGGLLGIGERNANSCLKSDAERAIVQLGGKLK